MPNRFLTFSIFAVSTAIATAAPNLLVNGDFENSVPALASTILPGWTVDANNIDIGDLGTVFNTGLLPKSGQRCIDLTGTPGAGTISQTVATTIGTRYILSGWCTVHAGIPTVNATAEVRANNQVIGTMLYKRLTPSPLDWEAFDPIVFVATTSATKISIRDSTNVYVNGGISLDALSLTVDDPNSSYVPAAKVAAMKIPALLPPSAASPDARAIVSQGGGKTLVAISGIDSRLPRVGSSALGVSNSRPTYNNPQPYNISYVVRLLADGTPDPTFSVTPGGDGTVNAMAVQADGQILVGGTFTTFDGTLFRNLARLKRDGGSDISFNIGSGADAEVDAIAVQADGKIIVGGAFKNFSGQAKPYLVRLLASGAIDSTFQPVIDGPVFAVAVQANGAILLGGGFSTVAGQPRARVARLTSSGSLDTTFTPGSGANTDVISLLLQPDGKIVLGGDFSAFNGQGRGRVTRLMSTGVLDTSFAPELTANDSVLAIGQQTDGLIVIAGAFTSINSVSRQHVARLLADGKLDPTFDPGSGTNQAARALLVREDGTIFLGGLFTAYQNTPVDQVVSLFGNVTRTQFTSPLVDTSVNAGQTARLAVEAVGVGALQYQWYFNDTPIPGATSPSLTLPNVDASKQGNYRISVVSSQGVTVTTEARLTVAAAGVSQVVNLSARTQSLGGAGVAIIGFAIAGNGTKPMIVRAVGPQLGKSGVSGTMSDPLLRLFQGNTQIAQNLDWNASDAPKFAAVGAFALDNASKDAALSVNVAPGTYTALTEAQSGNSGVVLVEAYDAQPGSSAALSNLSVRSQIGSGGNITIAGLVITGNVPVSFLFRGIGAGLADLGLDPAAILDDPVLNLYNSRNELVATSNDWELAPNLPLLRIVTSQVGAFPLKAGSKDAAILIRLSPGAYTLQCSGINGGQGIALTEAYVVP